MEDTKKSTLINDLFGGLAAMLVAMPSAIAFGLLVYAPLGQQFSSAGAVSGIVGAILIGLLAAIFGGAPRLISAPCAPAAAVLAAFSTQLMITENPALIIVIFPIIIALVGFICGIIQFFIGVIGAGKLIKYIPYPVVAGYLSGVGLIIFFGQIPKLLGFPKDANFFHAIIDVTQWNVPSLWAGGVSMLIMLFAKRITRSIPAPILALAGGVFAYFSLTPFYPELKILEQNSLIIGPIQAFSPEQFLNSISDRMHACTQLGLREFANIIGPALTLAVLLSIDTLKTCVIVDALTQSRHDSNKELRAQGIGNMASGIFGGLPGAGTMGATLVNINSGGHSRISGVFSGIFALVVFIALGNLVAWIPVAALAGILVVVGIRMIDIHNFNLLKNRSTILDFSVIVAVAITGLAVNLIAAAGVGIAMAIFLFLREQIRGSIVRRRSLGSELFSKKRRLINQMDILRNEGMQTFIFELQGALFFGTTDQLFTELEPHLKICRYLILDLKRIQSVDFTATHMLEQIEARINERHGCLIFTGMPDHLPTGQDTKQYFDQVGLVQKQANAKIFSTLDEALEWVEDETLKRVLVSIDSIERPLDLSEIDLLCGLPKEAIAELRIYVKEHKYKTGEKVFNQGENGDSIYFIRKGLVRIILPISPSKNYHLNSFTRGDFFGDMAFLDNSSRSSDAIAGTDLELYSLSRKTFQDCIKKFPVISGMVFEGLAQALAHRLRQTNIELRVLEEE